MKIFQFFRKSFAFLGVEPLQAFEKNHSMIMLLKKLPAFMLCTIWLICSVVFIGYAAKTIDDYADAFYMSVTLTIIILQFTIIIWKTDNLFKLFEDFENIVKKRKKI